MLFELAIPAFRLVLLVVQLWALVLFIRLAKEATEWFTRENARHRPPITEEEPV